MRKGFTLVELSIVLVIIGLLIGGILVAQSMKTTAKLAAQVSQIQQFDAGVENFKTRYRFMPGDAPSFGGDGDGIIDSADATNRALSWGFELTAFWNNWNPDEYKVATTPAVSKGPNKAVPAAKMGRDDSIVIADVITTDNRYSDGTNRNFYVIFPIGTIQIGVGIPRFAATTSGGSSFTPAELLALDKKIDDGIANTGYVLSGDIGDGGGGAPGFGAPILTPLATCSSGATYAVANQTYECTPMIRIGGMAGDPM